MVYKPTYIWGAPSSRFPFKKKQLRIAIGNLHMIPRHPKRCFVIGSHLVSHQRSIVSLVGHGHYDIIWSWFGSDILWYELIVIDTWHDIHLKLAPHTYWFGDMLWYIRTRWTMPASLFNPQDSIPFMVQLYSMIKIFTGMMVFIYIYIHMGNYPHIAFFQVSELWWFAYLYTHIYICNYRGFLK